MEHSECKQSLEVPGLSMASLEEAPEAPNAPLPSSDAVDVVATVVALMALGDVLRWEDTTLPANGLRSVSKIRTHHRYEVRSCRAGCSGWGTYLEYTGVAQSTDLGPVLPTFDAAKSACAYHYATGGWDWNGMPAVSLTEEGLDMLITALSKHAEDAIGEVDTIYNQLAFGETTGLDVDAADAADAVDALEQTFGERDKHANDLTALLSALQSEARRRNYCITLPRNGTEHG